MTTHGDIEPAPDSATTSISVRGEAQRMVAPDRALVSTTVSATAGSKSGAISAVQAVLPGVVVDLTQLGGQVLTATTSRAPLTWSAQSIQTYEEFDSDKVTGQHGQPAATMLQ